MESLDKTNKILGIRIAIWMCTFFAGVAVLIAFWIKSKSYLTFSSRCKVQSSV